MSEAPKPLEDHPPALYAIVELFGHQRIAGRISEQTFGGASLVRVDVPEVTKDDRTIRAHTRSFGGGAIYAVNWCDEETARVAALSIEHEPMSPYSVRSAIEALTDDQRQRLLASSLPSTHRRLDDADEDEREHEADDIPY